MVLGYILLVGLEMAVVEAVKDDEGAQVNTSAMTTLMVFISIVIG